MGLIQIGRKVLGIRNTPAKAPRKRAPFRRRTKVQIQLDEIKALDHDLAYLRKKAEYDKATKRLGLADSDGGDSWADVLKKSLPDIIDMGKAFAGKMSKVTDDATAESPTQIPESASQPGDESMDTYSKAILPHVRGKSPEDAAAWLRAAGKNDPVMGKAVVGRLVKTPESGLRDMLNEYEAFAPAFIQYCRANFEWFVKVVRCLKPPTQMAPVDPVSAAL